MRRLAFVVVLAVSTSAWAANQTFHVRPDGHDTNCDGLTNASDASTATTACAKLTIQGAVNAWSGTGNTVLLHAGTINGGASCTNSPDSSGPAAITLTTSKSGASGAFNTIKAANDGTVSVSASGCDHLLHITGSFFQIGGLGTGEGFTVLGDSTMAKYISSGFPVSGAIVIRDPGTNHRIYGLNFLPLTASITVGETGHGQIQINGGPGNLNDHIAGNTIRMGNMGGAIRVQVPGSLAAHDCDNAADISFMTGGVIVENNTILHDNSDASVSGKRTQALGGVYAKDVIYRNNYIRLGTTGSQGPTTQQWYGISLRQSCHITIQNNYIEFYSNEGASYPIYSFCPADTFHQRHKWYNNTIYGNGVLAMYAGCAPNSEIVNNIVRGSSAASFTTGILTALVCGTDNLTVGYDAVSNTGTAFSTCAGDTLLGNNVTSDPALNLSGAHPVPFLRLGALSPAISAGCPATTCPNAPTTDYDGQTRSNPPDIGADEQAAAAPDTTAPSAIGNGYCTGSGTPLACCTGSGAGSCQLAVSAPTKAPQLGATITWKSTGDDTTTGTATIYTLRGVGKVNDATAAPTVTSCADGASLTAVLNASGTLVTTLPSPLPAGSTETWVVKGLRPNWRYAFAVCASDEASNQSALSNVVNITTAKYEGYGYQSTGGGFTASTAPTVCAVTSTGDSGAGTLRNCMASDTYIGFSTGGTINLLTLLEGRGLSNYTVDGSTAPSPGITIQADATIPLGLNDMIRLGQGTHVIWDYLRVVGKKTWPSGTASNNDLCFTVNNVNPAILQHLVLSHLTVRNCGDSAWDLYDNTQDASLANNLIVFNQHPQTTGGDTNSARIAWYRNLWAHNGERQPQFLDAHADMDLRNNVHYDWSYGNSGGSYAIRIRNLPAGSVSANIVNNVFIAGTSTAAMHYGTGFGCDAEEGTCPTGCAPQNANGTAGAACSTTTMGQLWVAGNSFSPGVPNESYSTVAAERPWVTSGAAVTTVLPTALCTTVLNDVGTHFPLSDETTAISDTSTAMACGASQTCGNNVAEGTEQCDGTDLRTHACAEFSCSVGTPTCSSCSIVQTGCSFCGPPRLKGGKITGGGGVR